MYALLGTRNIINSLKHDQTNNAKNKLLCTMYTFFDPSSTGTNDATRWKQEHCLWVPTLNCLSSSGYLKMSKSLHADEEVAMTIPLRLLIKQLSYQQFY